MLLLVEVTLTAFLIRAEKPICNSEGGKEPPILSQEGDVIIGGVFSFHDHLVVEEQSFTTVPGALKCRDLFIKEYHVALAMIFAIEEINNSSEILPGVLLGYKIYDACGSTSLAIRAAMALMNEPAEALQSDQSCNKTSSAIAIIGQSGSSPTIGVATSVGPFHIPVVSHFATCSCLSNRNKYPTF
uniref:Receptor ligand binding region domain-containing protein n=1 Tax=Lepisosteus oculatus TaxID=7918 RepID=W5M3M1_LEPOC